MSILKDFFKVATEAQRNVMGEDATYTRGTETIDLVVIPSAVFRSDEQSSGVFIQKNAKQFRIKRTDLVLASVLTEPRVRDEIGYDGSTWIVEDGGWSLDSADETFLIVTHKKG